MYVPPVPPIFNTSQLRHSFPYAARCSFAMTEGAVPCSGGLENLLTNLFRRTDFHLGGWEAGGATLAEVLELPALMTVRTRLPSVIYPGTMPCWKVPRGMRRRWGASLALCPSCADPPLERGESGARGGDVTLQKRD